MDNNIRTWFEFVSKIPERRKVLDFESLLFSVEFRLNREVIHHKRSVYTFLDLLGDLGGLFDALIGIMSYIVALYYNIFGEPI